MSGRARVLGSLVGSRVRGQAGGEALVVALDGDFDDLPERLDERLRLVRLSPALAPESQGEADDDALGALCPHELGDPREPGLGRGALYHRERPGDGSGRIRDGHAGAGRSVVESNDLHASALRSASSALASASPSFSGSRPPARAIVGLPPPPPPTSAAAARITSTASSRPSSERSKLATRCTRPSSADPSTTAAGARSCLIRSDSASSTSTSTPLTRPTKTLTPPSSSSRVVSICTSTGFAWRGPSLRARSSSPRSSSASSARPRRRA